MSDFTIQYVLPLLAETAIAAAVFVIGLVALRQGHRWAVWALVAGALWAGVQLVYVAEYVAVEVGSGGFAYRLLEWNLLEVLRWLRIAGLALLVPALWQSRLGSNPRRDAFAE